MLFLRCKLIEMRTAVFDVRRIVLGGEVFLTSHAVYIVVMLFADIPFVGVPEWVSSGKDNVG